MQLTGLARNQLVGALQVHDVDFVLLDVLFERNSQLRPFGVLYRDEVFDGHGVEHLTAETLGCNAGADAFAGGIDRSRRTGRTATHHQHIKGLLGVELLGLTRTGTGVDLGENFFQAHTALTEQLAVQVDARHRHDLAFGDFVLEQRAVNGDVLDARVQYCHQVQRLDDVRAVLAGLREIGFELELALQSANLFDGFRTDLGWVAANLQQRQNQRGEFVAHGDTGETQADIVARAVQRERRRTCVGAAVIQGDVFGNTDHIVEQCKHFLRLRAVIKGRDDLDGASDPLQVGFQLGFKIGVQHVATSCFTKGRNNNAQAITARAFYGAMRFTCSRAQRPQPIHVNQILPTRSRDGARVASPSFHLAGQTSPG